MGSIKVVGGGRINGKVVIQGSKNLAIPCLCSSVLFDKPIHFKNVPMISDVFESTNILECLGGRVKCIENEIDIFPEIKEVGKACLGCGGRSTILYCGPLLAKTGRCSFRYPGGCHIGKRPIDIHERILEAFGAQKNSDEDKLEYTADSWKGCEVSLPIRSVGATETGILSAILAKGTTIINYPAIEPEIMHLCEFLNSAGASIVYEEDRDRFVIDGVTGLQETTYKLAADRIVAGTYMIYTCMCKGHAILIDAPYCELESLIELLRSFGAFIRRIPEGMEIYMNKRPYCSGKVETKYYPGFPTDLQSLILTLAGISNGELLIRENIFESRFETAYEFMKMGANVQITGDSARVIGTEYLENTKLTVPDLRGGAALLGAMLCGNGEGELKNIELIKRGYEDIVRDLKRLGYDGLEEMWNLKRKENL